MSAQEQTAPDGWEVKSLKSVADIRFSSVDKKSRPGEKPVRLCNYLDAYQNEYLTGRESFMRATATEAEIAEFSLQNGDIIVTKDSETPDDIAVPSVFVGDEPDLVCGYHLALIRTDKKKNNPVFLAKQIRHHRLARYFGRMSNGLTRYGLPTSAFDLAEIWRPELPEQNGIARVLQDADEAIRQTAEVIAKLKKMKAGLLFDLLTRGIDDRGQLRDPVRQPEQFKDSVIGLVPKSWDVKAMVKAAKHIQDGTHFSPHSKSGPFLYLTSKNIRFGMLDLTDVGHISEKDHDFIYSRCPVEYGDVLLTKDGVNTGNAALNTLTYPFSLLSSVAFIRCDGHSLHGPFVLQYLLAPLTQRRLKDLMSGNAIPRITVTKIEQFPIPVPDPDEQLRIVRVLESHDERLRQEETTLNKLILMKQGLMHDLLTGRVRVPEKLRGAKHG